MAFFLAVVTGILVTYGVTAVQLALAFPDPQSGVAGAVVKFLVVFAPAQIPLALSEGLLTVVMMNAFTAADRADPGDLAPLQGRGGQC